MTTMSPVIITADQEELQPNHEETSSISLVSEHKSSLPEAAGTSSIADPMDLITAPEDTNDVDESLDHTTSQSYDRTLPDLSGLQIIAVESVEVTSEVDVTLKPGDGLDQDMRENKTFLDRSDNEILENGPRDLEGISVISHEAEPSSEGGAVVVLPNPSLKPEPEPVTVVRSDHMISEVPEDLVTETTTQGFVVSEEKEGQDVSLDIITVVTLANDIVEEVEMLPDLAPSATAEVGTQTADSEHPFEEAVGISLHGADITTETPPPAVVITHTEDDGLSMHEFSEAKFINFSGSDLSQASIITIHMEAGEDTGQDQPEVLVEVPSQPTQEDKNEEGLPTAKDKDTYGKPKDVIDEDDRPKPVVDLQTESPAKETRITDEVIPEVELASPPVRDTVETSLDLSTVKQEEPIKPDTPDILTGGEHVNSAEEPRVLGAALNNQETVEEVAPNQRPPLQSVEVESKPGEDSGEDVEPLKEPAEVPTFVEETAHRTHAEKESTGEPEPVEGSKPFLVKKQEPSGPTGGPVNKEVVTEETLHEEDPKDFRNETRTAEATKEETSEKTELRRGHTEEPEPDINPVEDLIVVHEGQTEEQPMESRNEEASENDGTLESSWGVEVPETPLESDQEVTPVILVVPEDPEEVTPETEEVEILESEVPEGPLVDLGGEGSTESSEEEQVSERSRAEAEDMETGDHLGRGSEAETTKVGAPELPEKFPTNLETATSEEIVPEAASETIQEDIPPGSAAEATDDIPAHVNASPVEITTKYVMETNNGNFPDLLDIPEEEEEDNRLGNNGFPLEEEPESSIDNEIADTLLKPPRLLKDQTVDLRIKLKGESYNGALRDPSSVEYQHLARHFKRRVEDAFENLPGFKSISIIEFRPQKDLERGLVVQVHYSITVEVEADSGSISNDALDFIVLQNNLVEKNFAGGAEQPTVIYTITDFRNYITEALHKDTFKTNSSLDPQESSAENILPSVKPTSRPADTFNSMDNVLAAEKPPDAPAHEADSSEVFLKKEDFLFNPIDPWKGDQREAVSENDVFLFDERTPAPPPTSNLEPQEEPNPENIQDEGFLFTKHSQHPGRGFLRRIPQNISEVILESAHSLLWRLTLTPRSMTDLDLVSLETIKELIPCYLRLQ
ncbi:hypothetical protein OJAV_G00017820 [Oryzias javanicus]|uniref:SEA domain-containing protein n=1 Tax=Oryzias javanicus TaxID=123683 RepID=A0A437DKV1_ORYJA|nr:hypothetical protein OJAV_G00017820 [Oryzias javanicus]